MDDAEDQRDVELSSLAAIFPEIQMDEHDPHAFSLEIPVNPAIPVSVTFPAPAGALGGSVAGGGGGGGGGGLVVAPNAAQPLPQEATHKLSYLPALRLHVSLPPDYPAERPPTFRIETFPPWLPDATLKKLEREGSDLWEEFARDLVVYSYIDQVQQHAERAFGIVNDEGTLEVDSNHKIAILDYDSKQKQAAFDRETFECGVCLDPKRGSSCHRMADCGHVFCVQCLQAFYNDAVTRGEINTVRCLAPSCAKERADAHAADPSKTRKPNTSISPSELLQIPLEQDMVKRYVTLKYKTVLESDKDTIYCPRSWCNGAARSNKRKKPEGLELAEVSEDGGGAGDRNPTTPPPPTTVKAGLAFNGSRADLLAICEDCSFAFCSRCEQSWHGEFKYCFPKRRDDELTEEEKASLDYIKRHTTPCPTCSAPAQKTHGCNHMTCNRCETHFCYLCSSWLDPKNPYKHFSETKSGKRTSCYQRLWELEEGDGDDVDHGYDGGDHDEDVEPVDGGIEEQAAADAVLLAHLVPEIEEPDTDPEDEDEDGAGVADRLGGEAGENDDGDEAPRVAVAREGPLVLRIGGNNPLPRGVGRGGPRRREDEAAGRRGGGHRGRGGRGGARGRGAAVRGGGGGGGVRGGANNGNGRRGAGPAPINGRAAQQGRPRLNNGAEADDGIEVVELDEAHQAWVRHFVRLALNDEEDLMEDSDDE